MDTHTCESQRAILLETIYHLRYLCTHLPFKRTMRKLNNPEWNKATSCFGGMAGIWQAQYLNPGSSYKCLPGIITYYTFPNPLDAWDDVLVIWVYVYVYAYVYMCMYLCVWWLATFQRHMLQWGNPLVLEDHQSSPNSYFTLTIASSVIYCAGSHKTLKCLMLLIRILKKMIVCVRGGHMPGHTWRSETTPWNEVSLPTST